MFPLCFHCDSDQAFFWVFAFFTLITYYIMYASYIINIYIYISIRPGTCLLDQLPRGPRIFCWGFWWPWCWATLGAVNGVVWTLRYRDSWLYDSLWCFVAIWMLNMVMINRWTWSSPANKPIYTNKTGWSVGIASHKGAASKLLYLGYLNYQLWVGSNVGTDLTQWFNLGMPVFWIPYDAVIGFKGRKTIMYLVAHPTY